MSDGISAEALAESLFKTTKGVVLNNVNSVAASGEQPVAVIGHSNKVIGGIKKFYGHLNNAQSLKKILLDISAGNIKEATGNLTVLLATVLPNSPKFINEVEETLNKLPQGKEAIKISREYLAKAKIVPYIGPIIGVGTALSPIIAKGDVSRESLGHLGVAACKAEGGLIGGQATQLTSEAAAEACAHTLGGALNVKLEGSGILDKIEGFKDFVISQPGKFEVSNVKSWEGIPALTPSVKREFSSKNPPTI